MIACRQRCTWNRWPVDSTLSLLVVPPTLPRSDEQTMSNTPSPQSCERRWKQWALKCTRKCTLKLRKRCLRCCKGDCPNNCVQSAGCGFCCARTARYRALSWRILLPAAASIDAFTRTPLSPVATHLPAAPLPTSGSLQQLHAQGGRGAGHGHRVDRAGKVACTHGAAQPCSAAGLPASTAQQHVILFPCPLRSANGSFGTAPCIALHPPVLWAEASGRWG